MKKLLSCAIAMLILSVLTACGGDHNIVATDIIGKWQVSNEKIDLKKFTTKHGQISLLERLRVEQHFKEGNIIEFKDEETIVLPSISAKYKLSYQDGNNFISLIGESSKSIHPLYLKGENLQLSTFILKRVR
jgi:hypothetical protein